MTFPLMSPPPQDQADAFQRLFHCPLRRYWHPVFGFEIVRFDQVVVHSGDRSMRAAIVEQYGEEAAQLVEALLAYERSCVPQEKG